MSGNIEENEEVLNYFKNQKNRFCSTILKATKEGDIE